MNISRAHNVTVQLNLRRRIFYMIEVIPTSCLSNMCVLVDLFVYLFFIPYIPVYKLKNFWAVFHPQSRGSTYMRV